MLMYLTICYMSKKWFMRPLEDEPRSTPGHSKVLHSYKLTYVCFIWPVIKLCCAINRFQSLVMQSTLKIMSKFQSCVQEDQQYIWIYRMMCKMPKTHDKKLNQASNLDIWKKTQGGKNSKLKEKTQYLKEELKVSANFNN